MTSSHFICIWLTVLFNVSSLEEDEHPDTHGMTHSRAMRAIETVSKESLILLEILAELSNSRKDRAAVSIQNCHHRGSPNLPVWSVASRHSLDPPRR